MAKGRPSNIRDNFGRFQKRATINITKQLEKIAKETEIDIKQQVSNKLLKTYKTNVELSYMPRSVGAAADILYNENAKKAEWEDRKRGINARHKRKRIPYIHTGKFLESLEVVIEDHRVRITQKDLQYDNGKSTLDVYEYLTDGTPGGGYYKFTNHSKQRKTAYNYPTPKHEFEAHTMIQMKAYLETLKREICKK